MRIEDIKIIETSDADLAEILLVEKLAFGSNDEAHLVEQLLQDITAQPLLSLLAFHNQKAVGHILFTKVSTRNTNSSNLYLLAPLAVVPEYQNQGMGGLLINEGVNKLKNNGAELIFVLGHKKYYPKYGFIPNAKKNGFPAPFHIPKENLDAWMYMPLINKDFSNIQGNIICSEVLNKPEYWCE